MTQFARFINEKFAYTTKQDSTTIQHETSLVECNFSRLPKQSEYKNTDIGVAMNNLYNSVCGLAVQTSDNQRNKYSARVNNAVKAWFDLADIAYNDGNVSAFHMVCGIKKSTTKGEVNSALPSKSTFFKNVLFCTYKFKTINAWVSKDPLAKKSDDSKSIQNVTFVDYMTMTAKARGITVEQLKNEIMNSLMKA